MVVIVSIRNISDNDADYLARTFYKYGADPRVDFNEGFAVVSASKKGSLEELAAVASIAFHFDEFNVEFIGGDYCVKKEKL